MAKILLKREEDLANSPDPLIPRQDPAVTPEAKKAPEELSARLPFT